MAFNTTLKPLHRNSEPTEGYFQDATSTPITSPIAQSQTDKVLIPPPSSGSCYIVNPANSTGVVTLSLRIGSTSTGGTFTLGPGDFIDIPCNGAGDAAGLYFNRIYVTTAASTTCCFMFRNYSPQGA